MRMLFWVRQNMPEHDEEHKGIPSQNADVPNLVISKIRRERIGLANCKADRANGIAQSARDHEDNGIHAELSIGGLNEKDHDPAHEQKGSLRKPDRNLGEENGFECNEENCQTPDDAEEHPTCRTAENGETKRCVCACDQNINGVVVEDTEDAVILFEQQKEMQ